MNAVESMLLESMESEKFHDVTTDDFSFADSLIDQSDLEKINNTKEENTDVNV